MTERDRIQAACRLVAQTYYGGDGLWLCDAFEAINVAYFDRNIPYPHISIEITPHGSCLGWCWSHEKKPPRIAIHPTAFGPREKENPWGIPDTWLGRAFAFDLLLHECLHASVFYRLGGATGSSSHNNPQWVGEVNRLAPRLGFQGVVAGRLLAKRVPVEGPLGKRGKKPTKVCKVTDGTIPFHTVAGFPLALRLHQGTAAAYYQEGSLPLHF